MKIKQHTYRIFLFMILFSCIIGNHIKSYGQINENDLRSTAEDFEKFSELEIESFNDYTDSVWSEYKKYLEQSLKDYNAYIEDIKQIWGGDTIIDDTKTKWVEYSNNYRARSIVNFNNGEISIEIALTGNEQSDSTIINSRLTNAIEHMLNSRGSTCSYKSNVEISESITQEPILNGIVDLSKYKIYTDSLYIDNNHSKKNTRPKPATPTVKGKSLQIPQRNEVRTVKNNKKTLARLNIEKENKKGTLSNNINSTESHIKNNKQPINIAQQIVLQSNKTKYTLTGLDGKKRTIVKVKMALVNDNISKSAAFYKDIVKKYSEKFNIEQPLIFAVIEQESYFNPEATSHVPAYGLMQLVPTSGGVHAFEFVYGYKQIPSKSYLFIPDKNIELGTAYLRILFNQFNEINDYNCRRLCVIASYNTGAGNVSRAFTGTTKLGKAFDKINQYSYNQLYKYLTTNLNSSEARNYVIGVTKRREKYLAK